MPVFTDLVDWTIAILEPYGSAGLFLLAFIESSFFPVPPDMLLIGLALLAPADAILYGVIATVGSVMGGIFGYWIGFKVGEPVLERFVKKEHIENVHDYFNRYEAWAVGIAGLTPIPYKVFTIGFFVIHREPDPLRSGSCGCGIVLEAGCEVTASFADEYEILVNGSKIEARTTMRVVKKLADRPVRIECLHQTPVGGGFGASAASALATAYALNELFSLGKTGMELGQIAHIAEVEEVTGLGDVIAADRGGVVLRKKAGGPGFGILDSIPSCEHEIFYVVLGKCSTKAILTDEDAARAINRAGSYALKEILNATLKGVQ